ncbi:hypothetical protein C0991_006446 [Blastosporella zonata]|nr:hypothetical protein C0991_006446 [Blastosporella zonata]
MPKQEQIEHYEGKLDTAEGDPRDSAMDTDGPAHAEATFLNWHANSLMNNADLLCMLQDIDFDQPAVKGRTAAVAPAAHPQTDPPVPNFDQLAAKGRTPAAAPAAHPQTDPRAKL